MVKSPKLDAGDLQIFHLTCFKFTSFNCSSKTSVRKVCKRKHLPTEKNTCSITSSSQNTLTVQRICLKPALKVTRASPQLQNIKINKFIESQRLENASNITSPTTNAALPRPSPHTPHLYWFSLKWHIPLPLFQMQYCIQTKTERSQRLYRWTPSEAPMDEFVVISMLYNSEISTSPDTEIPDPTFAPQPLWLKESLKRKCEQTHIISVIKCEQRKGWTALLLSQGGQETTAPQWSGILQTGTLRP